MFKVNNKGTKTTSVTFGVFIVNFEHISHLFLVFLLLDLNIKMFSVSVIQKNPHTDTPVKKIIRFYMNNFLSRCYALRIDETLKRYVLRSGNSVSYLSLFTSFCFLKKLYIR